MPEVHLLVGRFFRTEVGAPVVREPLQPCAFDGRQPPNGVSAPHADCVRVFVVPRHDGGRGVLLHLREAACGHGIYGVAVYGIECERYILVDAVALGTVLVLSTDHGALNGVALHNGNAALVAGGIAAVAVKRPCGFRFVDAAVGIVRLHGIGVLGADAKRLKNTGEIVLVRHSLTATRILLGERR